MKPWQKRLLEILEQTETSLYAVGRLPGMPSQQTIVYHLKRDPEWAAEVYARLPDRSRPFIGRNIPEVDTSWHGRFLDLLRAGLAQYHAVPHIGVARITVVMHRFQYPDFEADITAITSTDQHRRRRSLLLQLRRGRTLAEAAEKAGVPLATVKRWRREEELFDTVVVQAAADGGRCLSPYPRLTCPGPRCGTTTGYDYGCRKAPCTTAKTAPIIAKRKEKAHDSES